MPTDYFSVKDRVVVVTGGLGQLGRQFCLALLESGAKVAVFDALAAEDRIAARFGDAKHNPNIVFAKVDITRRSSIEEALERMPLPPSLLSREEKIARIDAILATVPRRKYPTMAELDAELYDEEGNCR